MPISPVRRRATGGLLLVLGLGFFGWSAQMLANAFAVRGWPTVLGVVVESSVRSADDPADPATTMYSANVVYEYRVDGRLYSSRRVTFADHSSSRESGAAGIVERYAAGTAVTVHYDPADASNAMLDPRPPLVAFGPLALGVLAAVAGAIALAAPRAART